MFQKVGVADRMMSWAAFKAVDRRLPPPVRGLRSSPVASERNSASGVLQFRETGRPLRLIGGLAVASAAPPPRSIDTARPLPGRAYSGELAVLTYNVKGLPWPAASGRKEALAQIGARLAAMRRKG